MKLNKIFLPMVGALAVAAVACTDEVKYTPADPAPVTAYYFPTSNDIDIDLVDGTSSFTVTVARKDAGAALSLPVASSVEPAGAFTLPATVEFKEGEAIAEYVVGYDLTSLEQNLNYKVTLALDGMENTPYSYGTMTLNVLYVPWTDLGEGWYRDGYCYGMWNGLDLLEYQVKIQAHPTTEGIYRVVAPYAPDVFPYAESYFDGYQSSEDHYMVINAEDPERVYIESWNTGLLIGENPIIGWSMADYYMQNGNPADAVAANGFFGKLENGVITFGEKLLCQQVDMGDGQGYGMYYADIDGTFRVVLPGYEKPLEWEAVGMCEFTDGFYGKYLLGDAFQPTPYSVLVEQHMQETSQYRLVEPYGGNSGYENVPEAPDKYFYIDASNPDCVLWQYVTGSKFVQTPVSLGTLADYTLASDENVTMEEVENAEIGGKFADKVFTVEGDYCGAYAIVRRGGFWPSGFEAKLDLNTAQPVEGEGEAASRKAPARLTLNKQYLVK